MYSLEDQKSYLKTCHTVRDIDLNVKKLDSRSGPVCIEYKLFLSDKQTTGSSKYKSLFHGNHSGCVPSGLLSSRIDLWQRIKKHRHHSEYATRALISNVAYMMCGSPRMNEENRWKRLKQ